MRNLPFFRGSNFFAKFWKIPLATRQIEVMITNVPPYDDFGDWATPKEPAAELFI
jgi:hypothetical protein